MLIDEVAAAAAEEVWASADGALRVAVSTGADGPAVVALMGELDVANANEVQGRLAEVLATGQHVVVDLAALSFIDSSGLRALCTANKLATQAGLAMALRSPRPNVVRTVEVIGLDKVLMFEELGA